MTHLTRFIAFTFCVALCLAAAPAAAQTAPGTQPAALALPKIDRRPAADAL
jgi:hypothetical protein